MEMIFTMMMDAVIVGKYGHLTNCRNLSIFSHKDYNWSKFMRNWSTLMH